MGSLGAQSFHTFISALQVTTGFFMRSLDALESKRIEMSRHQLYPWKTCRWSQRKHEITAFKPPRAVSEHCSHQVVRKSHSFPGEWNHMLCFFCFLFLSTEQTVLYWKGFWYVRTLYTLKACPMRKKECAKSECGIINEYYQTGTAKCLNGCSWFLSEC